MSKDDELLSRLPTTSMSDNEETELVPCAKKKQRPLPLEVDKINNGLQIPGIRARRDDSPGMMTHADEAEFSLRAVLVGLFVGILLCFTNTYFGLQTGWVTMGSIQAAVCGFGISRMLFQKDKPLTRLENVVLQTVSVATATMPLTAGFVGIIPALKLLDPPVELTVGQQILWSFALTYFGIFFTVPLRRQTIIVERLPFPSGTATAKLIDALHSLQDGEASDEALAAQWRSLRNSFAASFLIALIGFFYAKASNLFVFSWIGLPVLTRWHWTFRPALSYVGQGMIMGPRPVFSMLLGAVIAWAFLGPMSWWLGWAPGAVDSWQDGAQGWVLWVAIGLMLGEALTMFFLSFWKEMDVVIDVISELSPMGRQSQSPMRRHQQGEIDLLDSTPEDQLVPTSWWLSGWVLAMALNAAIISPIFDIPFWQTILAALLSCLIAILAVRALGQTDLNPCSGVGKLSQLIFAVVAPGQTVTNIVAGAVVEAGAMQAGDMMQALKTGHLIGSSPRAQFWGQLLGSTASVFVSVGAYQLYDYIYGIPSTQFQAPVAHVWAQMAFLMKVGITAVPSSALVCAAAAACVGVSLPLLEYFCSEWSCSHYIPSGVAVGIGMYLTADWTLPRVWGAVAAMAWKSKNKKSFDDYYIMVASGFVLGEVMMSLLALLLKSLHVKTY